MDNCARKLEPTRELDEELASGAREEHGSTRTLVHKYMVPRPFVDKCT